MMKNKINNIKKNKIFGCSEKESIVQFHCKADCDLVGQWKNNLLGQIKDNVIKNTYMKN